MNVMTARSILASFTIIALPWMCSMVVVVASCDGSPPEDTRIVEVTLPPSPPVCEKNPAELLIFTDYHATACSGNERRRGGGGNTPRAPAGSHCDTGLSKCKPIDCGSDPKLCTGDTICNE